MSYIFLLQLVLCDYLACFFRITFKVMLFTLIQDCCYCKISGFTGSIPAKHHQPLIWLATVQ